LPTNFDTPKHQGRIYFIFAVQMKLTNAFVYIMSNQYRTVLYIGVTNDLERRVWEHCSGEGGDFTRKYQAHHLVYYEAISDIKTAIKREKQLKNWHREWKLNLIMEMNLQLKDLAADWAFNYEI
jgi:putative endonuclease